MRKLQNHVIVSLQCSQRIEVLLYGSLSHIIIICSGILTKRLFLANEILQGCLIHVQSLCEAASNSRTGYGTEASGILLVNLDKRVTYSLESFMDAQHQAADDGVERLLALRKHIILVVWESCAVSRRLVLAESSNL